MAVLVLLAGGAGSVGASSTAGPPKISTDRAIAAALTKFPSPYMLAPFPRRVGRVACQIPSGGISLAPIPGNCQTRVSVNRNYVTVAFTQAWDAEAFNGEGDRVQGALTRSWIVVESLKLKPLTVATFGDLPPQWVR
ncbi:MAG: hypothetical protein M3540_09790 [Actinomycetota bacterium]|nr:hypothetical protein [Actinomycetota bacterium]